MSDMESEERLKAALSDVSVATTSGDVRVLEWCHGLICVTGGNPPDLKLDNSNYHAPGDTPTSVFARQ